MFGKGANMWFRFDIQPDTPTAAPAAPAKKPVRDDSSGDENSGQASQSASGDSGSPVTVPEIMKQYGWNKHLAAAYLKSREYAIKSDVIPILEPYRDWLQELHKVGGEKGGAAHDPVFMFALMFFQASNSMSIVKLQQQLSGLGNIMLQAALDMYNMGPNVFPSRKTMAEFQKKTVRERRTLEIFRQLKEIWIRKFGSGYHDPDSDVACIENFMAKYMLGPLLVRLVRSCLREAIIDNPRLLRQLPAEFLRTYGFSKKGRNILRIERMKMKLPANMVISHVGYLIWFAKERPVMRELESYRELESTFHEHFENLKGQIPVWGAKIPRAVFKR
jgi:hypothetical protein